MKIRKVTVANGISWVEIEEADLRVLCGSPADAVKHLMRRGLISTDEVDGISCETGPNAILVSDTMLQGGTFANLAEFPVLQMLYRQGLLLPDHPNNTGQKPLLIGLPEQIESQLNYIYRGNYGLVSTEEMREAGCTEEQAQVLMRIKLRFAFGRIQPANELLECRPVGRKKVEVRNGVFVRRLGLNRYRFEYGGEIAEVNLNLPKFETYPSPYPLGMHQVGREYFSVVHSGEGDGWDIDRPCMSSLISFQGRLYLIDAGPNLQDVLTSLSISVNEIEGIFHTHSHDDHFAGLTALLQADHKLRYFATPLVRSTVIKKLSALLAVEETHFGRYFDFVDLEADTWNEIDGLEVMPLLSPHPVETSIFQFRALGSDGYRTYAHLADITADRVLESMVTEDDRAPGMSVSLRDQVKSHYLETVDLKKIDIGGGLIHGDALDFVDDTSAKIVLSHVARALSVEEKQIGSGADFGTADTLIPTTQDYVRRLAYECLAHYFPDQPLGRLQILLNNEVRVFNPHEILLREGEPARHLLLILSGNAEGLKNGITRTRKISAGALLGELPVLSGNGAFETYRATSYLHALVVPANLYSAFVDQYADRETIEEFAEKRRWLDQTWLFGEGLSYPVLNQIAKVMEVKEIQDGEVEFEGAEAGPSVLQVVQQGIFKRFVGDTVVETLRSGDFFNEDRAAFGATPASHLRSVGTSQVWEIPVSNISDIPIVCWKLYETHRRRLVVADAAASA